MKVRRRAPGVQKKKTKRSRRFGERSFMSSSSESSSSESEDDLESSTEALDVSTGEVHSLRGSGESVHSSPKVRGKGLPVIHVPGLLESVLQKFQRCKSSTALTKKPEMMEEPFEEITEKSGVVEDQMEESVVGDAQMEESVVGEGLIEESVMEEDQIEEDLVVEEHSEESIGEGQVASGSANVPLFEEGVELFHAFFWANWRLVAKDLNTGDRKQIFAGVEKLFDSTLAAVNKKKGKDNVSVATSPKRPPTQFVLFSKEMYSATAKRVREGGVASKDVQKETSRELSRIWKAMSPKEREPYAKRAADLRKVFLGTK